MNRKRGRVGSDAWYATCRVQNCVSISVAKQVGEVNSWHALDYTSDSQPTVCYLRLHDNNLYTEAYMGISSR